MTSKSCKGELLKIMTWSIPLVLVDVSVIVQTDPICPSTRREGVLLQEWGGNLDDDGRDII